MITVFRISLSIVCENVREGNEAYELYPVGAIHELPLQIRLL